MKKHELLSIVVLILFFINIYIPKLSAAEKPLTVAEASQYKSTSTYNDVMQFIQTLQKQSSKIRVETICQSVEGRKIPLLILGDPAPMSPLDLRNDERAVVYFQANIHAGEVEGKEAVLMLARDILANETPDFLDKLIILITPIFNADGNEKISKRNRKRQHGPINGVGVRYNGQKLDLNRDGIKLESPELQGMVKNVLNRWDPLLFVDCHTTNGSFHEEPLTYTWGVNPNGDASLVDYVRLGLLPFVQKNLKEKYQILSIPYGNFMDFQNPEKGWTMAGPECRYLTNYVGLRNRLSILNENYSYSDFKTRVRGCYGFLHSILEYCSDNKNEIIQLIRKADEKVIKRGFFPQNTDSFFVKYDLQAYEEPVTILGWEMEYLPKSSVWPPLKVLEKKRTYTLPYYCKYVPTHSVRFPYGYFISSGDPKIVEKLLQHGLVVERITKPVTIQVESFQLTELKSAENVFQGHHLNKVKGEYNIEEKTFPAGTYFVPTGQRLGSLAAYLLEPESEDGLLVWNFFDLYLTSQWGNRLQKLPVYRVLTQVSMAKESIAF